MHVIVSVADGGCDLDLRQDAGGVVRSQREANVRLLSHAVPGFLGGGSAVCGSTFGRVSSGFVPRTGV